MPRVTRGLGAVVFAIIFWWPTPASAGLIDFIYELSGPQFIGVPISCIVDLPAQTSDSPDFECRLSEIHIFGDNGFVSRATPRFRFELGGGVYFSTGKNSDLRQFEAGKVQLFAYEPLLHFRSFERRTQGRSTTTISHGVMGLSYFLVTGSDFKRFDNVGMKFAPIEFRYGKFSIAYTLRIFPNAFTAEQFGAPAGTSTPEGTEVVQGILIGWRFRSAPGSGG